MTVREFMRDIPEKTGAMHMPAPELPSGRWITDSSPMIDWFETQYPGARTAKRGEFGIYDVRGRWHSPAMIVTDFSPPPAERARRNLVTALAALGLFLAAACTHAPAPPPLPVTPPAVPAESVVDTPAPVTGTEAMLASLNGLASHGLGPAAYDLAGIAALEPGSSERAAAVRSAWLLAATHLRHGALTPDTRTLRTVPDASLTITLDSLPPLSEAAAYRAALDGLAPPLPAYEALRQELAAQQEALTSTADAETAAHIGALRASLERLRELPRGGTQKQVIANIPAFEVILLSGSDEAARHKAVFGKTTSQTPEFSDRIEYVVFNPWWEVPASIARHDKLAQFQRDPHAIDRMGYRILDKEGNAVDPSGIDWSTVSASAFPYRIRQAPGASNALGEVKIMFPNTYNVYLHDTPEKVLFGKDVRAFSSGCIRVQDPLAVAEWVLAGTPDWDRTVIDTVVASGAETRVDLAAPLSVYVVYLTAYPGPDGAVAYSADIYQRDAALLEALDMPAFIPAALPPG